MTTSKGKDKAQQAEKELVNALKLERMGQAIIKLPQGDVRRKHFEFFLTLVNKESPL